MYAMHTLFCGLLTFKEPAMIPGFKLPCHLHADPLMEAPRHRATVAGVDSPVTSGVDAVFTAISTSTAKTKEV
ncbi:hypothetical protein XFEB_01777 [Xylella fastidiosa EB92.1]|nr:hypothetical protein XFEB_01777 [Xylella fastidiosa EB92.1]